MTEPILKPCPFCGKQPYVAEELDPDAWWYVACQTPGCILPCAGGHTSIESAIAKWNSRATPDRDSIIEDVRDYLQCVVDQSMSRNNSLSLAAELIDAIDAAFKTAPNGEKG
ncbi:Lar family restriction alleviation protein [Burkholderia sp. HI2500]|uniref:Lar family restriction alleviation protein n=1 Tax=Burkholderia sp. HI2500 TaxID=2015358 RepID=UPI0015C61172|nr:Lar family restriction alleviation protein [Burkholderia sp. HI2500]